MPKFQTESVISLVSKIANPEERYVLPSLQRPYVWKEKQIFKLFDSIMCNYPLGSLLIWRTKREMVSREFVKNLNTNAGQTIDLVPDAKPKNMVLDGQQRLQSLLIGMRGSHEGRSLYFNITSDPNRDPVAREKDDGLKFVFKFYKDVNKVPTGFILVKDLSEKLSGGGGKSCTKLADLYISTSSGKTKLDPNSREMIVSNIESFRDAFITNASAIGFNLIDEISNSTEEKSDEEIVEIFIRANSGGTKLTKSDLLFSLLSAGWANAYDEIKEIETELSSVGFDFSKDYILKALLICTGQGAAYQVKKFKQEGSLDQVTKNWKQVRQSIFDVVTFLKESTPVKSKKALVSQNSLLPVIAMRFAMGKKKWNNFDKSNIADYILRTTLAGSFNGAKDTLLDKLSESMKSGFNLHQIMSILKGDNRSVEFDAAKIWAITYSSIEKVYFCMSQVIPGVSLSEVSQKDIDHVISRDLLREIRYADVKLKIAEIDQLANLTILDSSQNKAKGNKSLVEWLKQMDPGAKVEYLRKNCIPTDEALWEPQKFRDFVEARKALILEKSLLGTHIAQRHVDLDLDVEYGVESDDGDDGED